MNFIITFLTFSGILLNHFSDALIRGEAEMINSLSYTQEDGFSYENSIDVQGDSEVPTFWMGGPLPKGAGTSIEPPEEGEEEEEAAEEDEEEEQTAKQLAEAEIIAGITDQYNFGRAKNILAGVLLVFMNIFTTSFILMALGWSPDIFA